MGKNHKNVPDFTGNYSLFEKEIEAWKGGTEMKPEQRGCAVALGLTGRARQKVFELDSAAMSSPTGLKQVMDILKKEFHKDEVDNKGDLMLKMLMYQRTDETITQYMEEFDSRSRTLKDILGVEPWCADMKGFLLLHNARLTPTDHKIV